MLLSVGKASVPLRHPDDPTGFKVTMDLFGTNQSSSCVPVLDKAMSQMSTVAVSRFEG